MRVLRASYRVRLHPGSSPADGGLALGEGSAAMKDAGVIEEDKIAWLQPVDYRSRRIAEQLGKLTVGRRNTF